MSYQMPDYIKKETKEFVSNPEGWGRNLICMKRYKDTHSFPDPGFILKAEPLKIYHGNIFALAEDGTLPETHQTYPDVDSMIADGWEVD